MARDPKVDAYIAKAAPFAQPILNHLRALVHEAVEGLDEALKWGMPHFLHKGKNLAGMSAFKAHAAFMIHGDGRQGDAMGQFGKITRLEDLPDDNVLKSKLAEAAQRIDQAGTALKPKSAARVAKPELPIPPEFAAALAANPAAKTALEGFSPSHRREYVEWISEAKRPETRDKRIAQAIEWLADGKKRNWKYENC
ncbi:YdeI/OmpD-associated family protein [Novosphingobium sp.]|uniref:YdeI/OmpD-associated family protein n=1 Tax=Novosphingobium sp. TaxID=1874826 RepID=UPI0025F0692D|nr:YdeI/OmpD-associated family protein [Novosphingobium sp.]MCC6925769.1 YdeI/OmpD-associated family protein [Novosphingobium sp.]